MLASPTHGFEHSCPYCNEDNCLAVFACRGSEDDGVICSECNETMSIDWMEKLGNNLLAIVHWARSLPLNKEGEDRE